MPPLPVVTAALERIAPLRLAADWDPVGLLVAPRGDVHRVLACLTLTPAVAAEAVAARADLVVTHHPLPFRPVGRITPETATGRVLLELVAAGCGVWSSHTAWDSAAGGINDLLAAMIGLGAVAPIDPDGDEPLVGFGRLGSAPAGETVESLARRLAGSLAAAVVQVAGDRRRPAGRVGIVCGSGGDLVGRVVAAGCQTLVTGEVGLHDAAEAVAGGLAVVAVGHHASEHFAMSELAHRLAATVPGIDVAVARHDLDPLTPL